MTWEKKRSLKILGRDISPVFGFIHGISWGGAFLYTSNSDNRFRANWRISGMYSRSGRLMYIFFLISFNLYRPLGGFLSAKTVWATVNNHFQKFKMPVYKYTLFLPFTVATDYESAAEGGYILGKFLLKRWKKVGWNIRYESQGRINFNLEPYFNLSLGLSFNLSLDLI